MCRALYTLEHGDVTSKAAAAQWTKTRYAGTWDALIDQSLAWRPGIPFDALPEVLRFLAQTIERAGCDQA